MRRVRKCIWKPFAMALALALVLGMYSADAVLAAGYDAALKGSVQVELNDLGTERGGVSLVCYKVASVSSGNGLSFVSEKEFESAEVDFNKLTSAEANREAADKLAALLGDSVPEETKPEGVTIQTKEDGTAEFAELGQGMYLFLQTGEDSYGKVAPFLVAVPYCEDGQNWVYDVKVQAKGELYPDEPDEPDEPNVPDEPDEPNEPDEPKKPDDSKKPDEKKPDKKKSDKIKTGDESPVILLGGALVLSAGAVVVILKKKKRT